MGQEWRDSPSCRHWLLSHNATIKMLREAERLPGPEKPDGCLSVFVASWAVSYFVTSLVLALAAVVGRAG